MADGIKYWLDSLPSKDILVSIFSFDVIGHNVLLYRTPSEILESLEMISISTSAATLLDAAINNYEEVLKHREGKGLKADEWPHHGVLIVAGEAAHKGKALKTFTEFRRKSGVKFFLTAITQTRAVKSANELATELGGNHYTIRNRANFGKAFVEAMQKYPLGS